MKRHSRREDFTGRDGKITLILQPAGGMREMKILQQKNSPGNNSRNIAIFQQDGAASRNEEMENFHIVMRNDDMVTNNGDEIVTNNDDNKIVTDNGDMDGELKNDVAKTDNIRGELKNDACDHKFNYKNNLINHIKNKKN